MPRTLKITPTESLTVRQSTPELLELEASYGPAHGPPSKHYHPHQDEHFEILEGEMRVRTDDEERTLSAGETIDIPRGVSHQMWNPGEVRARFVWQTRPGGRTEEWFASIDELHRSGRAESEGGSALATLLAEYSDVFRLASPAELR